MLLRHLFNLHRLMDELNPDGGAGGGGGEANLTIDIDKVSDAIGADLGLNEGEGTEDLDLGSATPPEKKEAAPPPQNETPEAKAGREAREKLAKDTAEKTKLVKTAREELKAKHPGIDKKTDAEVLELHKAAQPALKAAPKSWPKERHEIFAKLPPEAQAFIEQREAEIEEGFKKYGADAGYAKGVRDVMTPYEPLLTAQGVKDHTVALRAVMNAHYVLSTAPIEQRAKFFADLAKNYQVDFEKATAAYKATTPAESDEAKALRLRVEKMENDRAQENTRAHESFRAQAAAEVEAFASDPKHPYFNEVASEIALLMADPQMSMEQAYERAVYANPVARAKELERISKETAEKLRKESEETAAAAAKARGTKVRGEEHERASPDLIGSMDETMRETYKKVQSRQE